GFSLKQRQQHLLGDYQVRRQVVDNSAFASNLLDKSEFKLLQVPESAVDQLGRTAARAGSKILLFHQRNLQATRSCIKGNTRTCDATTDNEQVKFFRPHAVQQLIAERN